MFYGIDHKCCLFLRLIAGIFIERGQLMTYSQFQSNGVSMSFDRKTFGRLKIGRLTFGQLTFGRRNV